MRRRDKRDGGNTETNTKIPIQRERQRQKERQRDMAGWEGSERGGLCRKPCSVILVPSGNCVTGRLTS